MLPTIDVATKRIEKLFRKRLINAQMRDHTTGQCRRGRLLFALPSSDQDSLWDPLKRLYRQCDQPRIQRIRDMTTLRIVATCS